LAAQPVATLILAPSFLAMQAQCKVLLCESQWQIYLSLSFKGLNAKFPNLICSGDTGPHIRLAIYGIKLRLQIFNPNIVSDADGSHHCLHLITQL
jgi:hypothetical protein